MPTDTRLWIY